MEAYKLHRVYCQPCDCICHRVPSTLGDFTDLLEFSGSVFGSGTVSLFGEGTQVQISVSSDTIHFIDVPIAQNAIQCIELSNTGTGTMVLDSIQTSNSYLTFSVDSNLIPEGNSTQICFTYEASLAGYWQEEVLIYSTDPNNPVYEITAVGSSISEISGELNGTLGIINSPYFIIANAFVADGDSLTVEPGVEINFLNQIIFINSCIKN